MGRIDGRDGQQSRHELEVHERRRRKEVGGVDHVVGDVARSLARLQLYAELVRRERVEDEGAVEELRQHERVLQRYPLVVPAMPGGW